MLIEDITCPECGGNATLGEHETSCTIEYMMNDYCNVIESITLIPDNLLDKLKTLIYAAQMDRQIHKKR